MREKWSELEHPHTSKDSCFLFSNSELQYLFLCLDLLFMHCLMIGIDFTKPMVIFKIKEKVYIYIY